MTVVLGIDVGATKIAAGLVDVETATLVLHEVIATRPERGADAVLADVIELVARLDDGVAAVGIGVCELVDRWGRTTSAETIDWTGIDLSTALGTSVGVHVESDVRAAALAEAVAGAGVGLESFVYLQIGTGVSYSLVDSGVVRTGHRGNAIIVGAPPVEQVASGLVLERTVRPSSLPDALADARFDVIFATAAREIGAVVAVLVNALDPQALVIGGGLGTNSTMFARLVGEIRPLLVPAPLRDLAISSAALGTDSGVVGAALAASRALLDRGARI